MGGDEGNVSLAEKRPVQWCWRQWFGALVGLVWVWPVGIRMPAG